MKRAMAVAAVTAAMVAGGAGIAAPSQAASVKVGAFGQCATTNAHCGGYLWVRIPGAQIPEKERSSSLSISLRDRKGKRVHGPALDDASAAAYYSSIFDFPWYSWADIGGYSVMAHETMKGDGPLFALPTSIKAGRYKLTYKIKASGFWDCSLTYYSVCKWQKPYTYKKTQAVKIKPRQPVAWIAG